MGVVQTYTCTANKLKEAIRENRVEIINLQLTSDNRLTKEQIA